MNLILAIVAAAVAFVLVLVAALRKRPDLLRVEQVAPLEMEPVLAELRARLRSLAELSLLELSQLPESAVEEVEIEGVEVFFGTRRGEVDHDGVTVSVDSEIALGSGEHGAQRVAAACGGFRKTWDGAFTPLGVDTLGPFCIAMDSETETSSSPRRGVDDLSPPGIPSEQQRPMRVVEFFRLGPFRIASPCKAGRFEWTDGMGVLEEEIGHFADRVGRIEESRLAPEDLSEPVDVLGRFGMIFAEVDRESGDRPRVVIVGVVPMPRWPMGRWKVIAGYARNADGSASWLWTSALRKYW